MKVQKYSYLPAGHSHAINFGLGFHLDVQLQSHIVSLFALNDNGGAPLYKYLPEICLDVLEQCGGAPHKNVEDYIWTYSAGGVSSRLNFVVTPDGHIYHIAFSNPVAYMKELKAGSHGEGDFLWAIDEYEKYYNRESPLQVAKRPTPVQTQQQVEKNFYLVPSLSGEFAKHHLFARLIHADLYQGHISTRFFLADAVKLAAALRADEDVIHLRGESDKTAYVEKLVESNTPQNILDFGLWSCTGHFNSLTFASGKTLSDKCGEGLSILIERLGLPFIPVGLTHDAIAPQVEDRVAQLAYGETPIYLGKNGPLID